MDIDQRLQLLQRQVAEQVGHKVDLYYYEGKGALFVAHGQILHPMTVIFAFPDIAIRHGM